MFGAIVESVAPRGMIRVTLSTRNSIQNHLHTHVADYDSGDKAFEAVDRLNRESSRHVLCQAFDERGFIIRRPEDARR
jgi:pyridoxine/pyridoxamine 5'-phosphate oxidase